MDAWLGGKPWLFEGIIELRPHKKAYTAENTVKLAFLVDDINYLVVLLGCIQAFICTYFNKEK